MSFNTSPLDNRHLQGDSMLGEAEVTKPSEIQIAEEGHQVVGCGTAQNAMATLELLLLLVEAIQADGSPLTLRIFTARSVVHQIIGLTGRNPVDIDVMNDCNAIVQMEPEVGVVPVAQALHAKRKWEGLAAEITCLMSSCQNIVEVVKDREDSGHSLL